MGGACTSCRRPPAGCRTVVLSRWWVRAEPYIRGGAPWHCVRGAGHSTPAPRWDTYSKRGAVSLMEHPSSGEVLFPVASKMSSIQSVHSTAVAPGVRLCFWALRRARRRIVTTAANGNWATSRAVLPALLFTLRSGDVDQYRCCTLPRSKRIGRLKLFIAPASAGVPALEHSRTIRWQTRRTRMQMAICWE
jgi:hypothetical protein